MTNARPVSFDSSVAFGRDVYVQQQTAVPTFGTAVCDNDSYANLVSIPGPWFTIHSAAHSTNVELRKL